MSEAERVVEAAELGAGLDADRLDEHRARVPVGVQRGGLAAAAVEREHPQPVQALAQRFAGHPRVELAGHVGVAAGREVLADRLLDRREPQLLEARISSGATARWRRRRAAGRATARARRAACRREALEAADVEVAAVAEPQLVAAPARDDLRAPTARRSAPRRRSGCPR